MVIQRLVEFFPTNLLLWKTWSQFVLAVLGIVSPIPNSQSQYNHCFILSLDNLFLTNSKRKRVLSKVNHFFKSIRVTNFETRKLNLDFFKGIRFPLIGWKFVLKIKIRYSHVALRSWTGCPASDISSNNI